MPARPDQGSFYGTWGTVLDAYLDVSLNSTTGQLIPAAVQTALAGAVSWTGNLTITADSGSAGSGAIVFMAGSTEMAKIPNATVTGTGAQYGPGSLLVGNDHNSDYGPQTGSPAGNVLPIRFQQVIGTAGVTVKQTTQAFVGWAKYKERTVDDSAEAASWGVILTDAFGGFASPQTLPVVGFEGDALVQGAVSVTNKVIGITATVKIQNTAHADSTMNFYSAQTQVVGTITNRYAFYDEGITGAGTITNNWSFYGKFDVQTESRLYIGVAGVPAVQTQRVLLVGASTDTTGTLAVQMGSGQSSASIQVRDSGGVQRGQWFGSTGNLQIGNTATGGSGAAILSMATVTAPTGTPPASGSWWFIDPADGDAKVTTRNPGGTAGVTRRIGQSHEQILMEGLGFKSWAFDPNLGSGGTAPTQGTVYVRAIPLRAGQVITNVVLETITAASGTAPTSMFVGLADSTGKMVAQSNDLRASGIWTAGAGMVQAPLSGTYTVPADGMYYAVFLQVGAFSVTQPVFEKGVNNSAAAGVGTTIFGTGATTAQTALPANASNIAGGIVTTNGINYFFGAN